MNLTLARGLSLGDLGFSAAQAQGSAQDQARLDKRSHMLKVHQRIGLIDRRRDISGRCPRPRSPPFFEVPASEPVATRQHHLIPTKSPQYSAFI